MKSEKGISLVSLIIYLITITVVVGIVARISTYFYKNLNSLTDESVSESQFTRFNSYFTNDINISGNYIRDIGENQEYVIFYKSNNQYTYNENAIYLNNVKICSNVDDCEFLMVDNKTVMVSMNINGKYYYNVYNIY